LHPRSFVRDTLGTALSQYVARAMMLLRGLASAAALGPAGLGTWNALNLIFDYGSYASAGALHGLEVRLPASVARGEVARARAAMAGAWSVVMAGGMLFAAVIAVYLASGNRAVEAGLGSLPAALMLLAALLQLAIQYHVSALRSHHQFRAVSAALAAQAVIGGGLGLALVWRIGLYGLLAGWLAGSVLALAWLRRAAHRVPMAPGRLRDGLALAAAGMPIFGFFAASLVLRSLDRIALIRYVGIESLGHYSLGLMAVGLVLYLPEAVGAVLAPRIAAAAHGARDPVQTHRDVVRAQRALAVFLPLAVGLGMIWAAPVVSRLLPAFREAVPALRVLALGALALSAATLPVYFLLTSGAARGLLMFMALALALTAALVFGVALRDRRPVAIAAAAASGYALFALGPVLLAARRLCPPPERWRFVVASFLPAAWAGTLAWGMARIGDPESPAAALVRSLTLAAAYLPVLAWLGRGLGLRELVREWLRGTVRT
jgi:O-antigen/teichoic acid export membrane protein